MKFILCLALLVGCDIYRSSDIINLSHSEAGIWTQGVPSTPVLNPYSYNPDQSKQSLYQQAQGNSDAARAARNRLQSTMMTLSDQIISQHLSKITGLQVGMNTIMGAAASGLSAGAAIAAAPLAGYLAEASTSVNASQSLINEQVYRDALVQSLVGAIETDRAELAADIRERQRKSTQDYPVEAAIADANDYHQRGSFYHGLVLIRAAAEEANQTRAKAATPQAAQERAMQVNSIVAHP
jgi:hypothetical protein